MKAAKTSLALIWVLVAILLVGQSQQYLYTFKLPYCSDVLSDVDIVRNPLRIYLSIFRALFCLVGDPQSAKTTKGSFFSDAAATALAESKIAQQLSGTTTTSTTISKTTSYQAGKRIQIAINGAAIYLPSESYSKSLKESLEIGVKEYLTSKTTT